MKGKLWEHVNLIIFFTLLQLVSFINCQIPIPPVGPEFANVKGLPACGNLFIEDLVPIFRGDGQRLCGDSNR